MLLIESTLRFVPKTPEGADTVFEIDPLTALVNIEGGRYFDGLSNLGSAFQARLLKESRQDAAPTEATEVA